MNLSKRHRPKDREIKEILRKINVNRDNLDTTYFNKNAEIAQFNTDCNVLFIEGTPLFFSLNDEFFPTLKNKNFLDMLPKIIVDMGAVSHLCNGADLMAPGIVKILGVFQSGSIVVVVDEKFAKPICLVKTLYGIHELLEKKHGKVAVNMHYVGDQLWEAIKNEKSGYNRY